MKKLVLPLLLLLAFGMLLAVESAPSAVVGYVKYDCVAGLNLVALPMATAWTNASELGDAYTGSFDAIFYWDFDAQTWFGASDLGGFWDGDFEIASSNVLMLSSLATISVYSIGQLPASNAVYTLGSGLNTIMVPLNRNDLTLAGDLGTELAVSDAVFYWDSAAQTFFGASDLGGFWDGDFDVSIGMPLMVSAFDSTTWPSRSSIKTKSINSRK
ncbi:MAG: hypothetical protein CVU48_10630 [Candidatus Cloacimonetes bacterium HGW-Cloacimonetes-1]|jgi:hypothetical protein|nr:MAG: hypothetical protein CVU48_10630 [Candidatus Cloacimonetes bacterium HGW-Cloacimonetes-1]